MLSTMPRLSSRECIGSTSLQEPRTVGKSRMSGFSAITMSRTFTVSAISGGHRPGSFPGIRFQCRHELCQWHYRINPAVRSDRLQCIGGLRITVLRHPGVYSPSGMSKEEILADFSDLTADDIRAALAFAADGDAVCSRRRIMAFVRREPLFPTGTRGGAFYADSVRVRDIGLLGAAESSCSGIHSAGDYC